MTDNPPSPTSHPRKPHPTPQKKQVYKGVWRGSMVAIKTMLLPARMSGAEKRERMAVMEAAISSSLSHPNIVQVAVGAGPAGGEPRCRRALDCPAASSLPPPRPPFISYPLPQPDTPPIPSPHAPPPTRPTPM
jgi:hypothetical protein